MTQIWPLRMKTRLSNMRLILSTCIAFICFCVPVNAQTINASEGAGLLVSDSQGALPKGLWRNNPRSEIIYLLKNLPDEAPFKSLQEIKRNMLISTYDTSDIDNDISFKVGEDLLTLRLQKLLELGLWDDAYALYTKITNDPGQNSALAEVGIILSLYKNGIANACLDQKAFGQRFSGIFWSQINLVCKAEIYEEAIISTQFPNSSIFQSIYTDDDYKIPATNLSDLTIFELLMAQVKGRIDYTNFTLSPNVAPRILRTFLNDTRFPLIEKNALESLARQKVVIIEDEIKLQNETDEENIDNQLANDIQNKSFKSPLLTVAELVEKNQEIPQNLIQDLQNNTDTNPTNYFYLQLLNKFSLVDNPDEYTSAQIAESLRTFPPRLGKEVKILKTWLDNSVEFSNNLDKVYEKQISLASNGDIIFSEDDWTKWLGKTTSNQLAGLSLLIVLNNNKNNGVRSNQLINDLHYVGLIEQSHKIARDMTARLMRTTN